MSQKGFSGIIVLVVVLILAGAYFLGKSQISKPQPQTKVSQAPKISLPTPKSLVTPTPKAANTPTSDPPANWKTYSDANFSFNYPDNWKLISQIPEEFKGKEYGAAGWLNSKMFMWDCSGPILQNTTNPTSLIVLEVINIKERPDGGFCWSNGDFTDSFKRTASIAGKSETIQVNRWKLNPYLDPKDKVTKTPPWSGDYFEIFSFNTQSNENSNQPWILFALTYRENQDKLAEHVFDQIISTFKFTQ